jgi:hypothetical protein
MERRRFKTEKEYKKEYGPNWRDAVRYQWPEEMDDLLGSKYRRKELLIFLRNDLLTIMDGP